MHHRITTFVLGIFLAAALGAQPKPPHLYLSDENVANTQTANNQQRPSVAVGTDGNYLVVWNSDAAQEFFSDIKGQLFHQNGAKIGGEFQVDQAGVNRILFAPEVAVDGNGNYIVVWADFNNTVTDSEVWVRRFDGAGNPLADALQVNTTTAGVQRLPRIAAAPAGNFVVAWESAGQDGSGLGAYARKFNAAGNPDGGEFPVNDVTAGDQSRVAVDMDADGFAFAFNSGTVVAAREFDATGPLANQFTVFASNHRLPDVRRLDGRSNTLFIAEDFVTGNLDGRRSEDGVLQGTFPIATRGAVGSRGAGEPVLNSNGRLSQVQGDRLTAGWEWSSGGQFQGWGQQIRVEADGLLRGVGEAFPTTGERTVPILQKVSSGKGQDVYAAQAGGMPSLDGDGDAVTDIRAAFPFAAGGEVFDDDNGNGVSEASEVFKLWLTTSNPGDFVLALFAGVVPARGPLSSRPAGGGLTILDATADYGAIPPGGSANCRDATGDCYEFMVSGPRPAPHWDEAVTETLNTGVHKTWLLHVGESFGDAPMSHPFYRFIENLFHNGITSGCGGGNFCPAASVTRAQMAVFLLRGKYGSAFQPAPATGTLFDDVPAGAFAAAWIERLALEAITSGCGGGNYCPNSPVTREQMALFLLKAKLGSGHVPPTPTGVFDDVPVSNPFAKWIEELASLGITSGCGGDNFCPTQEVTRGQMGVFLVRTFGLLLYGP